MLMDKDGQTDKTVEDAKDAEKPVENQTEKPTEQSVEKPAETPVVAAPAEKPKHVVALLGVFIALEVAALVGIILWSNYNPKPKPVPVQTVTVTKPKVTSKLPGLQLDTKKNYGNKYASGVLPVGDGKYVTDKAKTGYIYACGTYAQAVKADTGGASTRGPWFTNNNTQYDSTKKIHVLGSVTWKAQFTNAVSGATRTITTNDLPTHTTGVFPIATTDPAYAYDKNPNTITGQSLTYALANAPTYSATPKCMGGQVGVMLTGIALFNAFDAGGRDAGAWEVQDSCGGHPEKEGEYHYHTLSSCITDVSVHTVLGYALDGFPITGPKVGDNNMLTTSDLDECHGITSQYFVDGKSVTGYHYVMTQDFPYSASCFRSTAIQPPGLQTPPKS